MLNSGGFGGATNGPTEALNLCVKKVKSVVAMAFDFENYRRRVLLHEGDVTWPSRPNSPRIKSRGPHSNA